MSLVIVAYYHFDDDVVPQLGNYVYFKTELTKTFDLFMYKIFSKNNHTKASGKKVECEQDITELLKAHSNHKATNL